MPRSSPIPRLYCWGLIEARRSGRLRRTRRSLFPGFIAGASLKPERAVQTNLRQLAIPRLYCWGLIEAEELDMAQTAAIAYSPALLLGPH